MVGPSRPVAGKAAPPPGSDVLACRGLVKRYGERTVVDDVGFTIAAGETYGLLGPNGAGKTTTISMLCGLLRRDGGSVEVIGHDLDAEPRTVQGAIGYVPQDLAIYPDLSRPVTRIRDECSAAPRCPGRTLGTIGDNERPTLASVREAAE